MSIPKVEVKSSRYNGQEQLEFYPPIAPDINLSTNNGSLEINIIDSCSDPADLDIVLQHVSIPENGLLTIIDDESVSIAKVDSENPSVVDYTIVNSEGKTATGTITLTWESDPVAVDDNVSTPYETAVLIDVLDNDTDLDLDTLTIQSVTDPDNGTAVIEIGQIRYTPDDDFDGEDTFEYVVSDGNGGTDTGTVTVTVEGAPGLGLEKGFITNAVDSYAVATSFDYDYLQGETKATISVWANIGTYSQGPSVSIYTGSNDRFEVYGNSGYLYISNRTQSGQRSKRILKSAISDGKHHFMAVWDGTLTPNDRWKLYIDSVEAVMVDFGTQANIDSIGDGSELRIGKAFETFIGSIQSNLSIDAGYAGTPTDAVNLFNGGEGALYADVVRTPTSYYKLDGLIVADQLIDEIGVVNLDLVGLTNPQFIDLDVPFYEDVNLIFDGNSFTFGVGSASTNQYFPREIRERLSRYCETISFESYGVGGQTIQQMIADFDTQIEPLVDPSKINIIIFNEDVNGVFGGLRSGAQNLADYNTYIQMCIDAGFEIIIPWGGWYARTPYSPTGSVEARGRRKDFFDLVDAGGLTGHTTYYDARTAPSIGGAEGQPQDSYFYDYVHLSQVGYDILADELFDVIKAQLDIYENT